MVNKIFIDSYLEKISKKFNINSDKAFEVFSIASFLDKPFDEVFDDIIIKNGDGGVDGAYLEENGNSYLLHIFQCKNTSTIKSSEVEYFKQCIQDVFFEGNINKPNKEGLKKIFEEYESLSKKGNYVEIKKYFIFNGCIDDSRTDNKRIFDSHDDYKNNFSILDINKIGKLISTSIENSSKRKEIKFQFKAVKSNLTEREAQAIASYNILNVKAINFRFSVLDLCELYNLEEEINGSGDTLFSENVRGFLGYNKTNKKIKQTLENRDLAEYFPFFNNGITIICSEMKVPSNSQLGDYIIPVKNPIIVNGLQTTRVIYDIYKKNPKLLEGVYVTIKLFETSDSVVIERITEATNTQNTINYKDKISNKNFQKYAKQFFCNKNIAYLNKRGNLFSDNLLKKELLDSISSDKILKFWYASFFEKPEVAKNSISKVLEQVFDATNEDNSLKSLFNGKSDSPIYYQLYITYKILKEVIKKRKLNNDQKDFIEHVDEILVYGIYKKIIDTPKKFNTTDILSSYDQVITTIEKIIKEEKEAKKSKGFEYSHNTYFKSSKCKIDYNLKEDLVESDNLCENLLSLKL